MDIPRDPLSRFYTKPAVARFCLDVLELTHPLHSFDLIVEPSAGDGAFADLIDPHENNVTCLDLDPDTRWGSGSGVDFLEWWPKPHFERILTLGNPPFGDDLTDAKLFVMRAGRFSRVVAFILPRGMVDMWTFPLLRVESVHHLPFDSFTLRGETVEVATSFVIYEKFF